MILVSGCLLGINCKYNGGNNKSEKLLKILDRYGFIPICPEQLGGMTTPRKPSEITKEGWKVTDIDGQENTEAFLRGAEETLKIAKTFNVKFAILKEKSPSCGSNYIYDGTFSGKLIPGKGFTAKLLEENGIKVYSEEEIEQFIEDIEQSANNIKN